MPLDMEQLVKRLNDKFNAEKAEGVEAVVQFELQGEESGEWFLQIKDQRISVQPGRYDSPVVTFTAALQDVKAIITGEVSPVKAFMSGAVGIQGDILRAMKIMELFNK